MYLAVTATSMASDGISYFLRNSDVAPTLVFSREFLRPPPPYSRHVPSGSLHRTLPHSDKLAAAWPALPH